MVAISQSGTTTDTNTTVDLARSRGAAVIAIVNRRNSDLVDRSDGVLYTSDGRDVEMSVASTKAFYAQVAAGFLLATALGRGARRRPRPTTVGSRALARPPRRDARGARRSATSIGAAAHAHAPFRRYWAVVGNGPNRIAAHEVRIKLSELCYKSIACDGTEDKKHIDLSSEPMILVCAAGLSGSNADDVAKELAIYRAHKAAAIAIVSEDDDRYGAAVEVIRVPRVHPSLGFVLSAMVGHLFGYEAALAIDASARPLREARAAVEADAGRPPSSRRSPSVWPSRPRQFFTGVRTGLYDGALEAATAVRLASVLRYAAGIVPLDVYSAEHGKLGTPAGRRGRPDRSSSPRRSRSSPGPSTRSSTRRRRSPSASRGPTRRCSRCRSCEPVLDAGGPRDGLTYKVLRTLVDLDPAVVEVTGWTRYRIEGDPESDDRDDRRRSTAAASRGRCARAPSPTRACAARSRRSRRSAQVFVTAAASTTASSRSCPR